MTNHQAWLRSALKCSAAGSLVLTLLGGCGSSGPQSTSTWHFAPSPSPSDEAGASVGRSTAAASPPSASEPASPSSAVGLSSTCAAQWVGSLSMYEGDGPGTISVVLLPRSGTDAPAVDPSAATLHTDQGPLSLAVATMSRDDNDTPRGTARVELLLPALDAGTYHAEVLDLTDASGTWRVRIGEFVISVLPGARPTDLERAGGTIEVNVDDGGSIQGFDIGLKNTARSPVEITGVGTEIPGLPVAWLLLEGVSHDAVGSIVIPAGEEATLTVGTRHADKSASFVLATPSVSYRLGDGLERRVPFDPIVFTSGFGQPSDFAAYRAALPPEACAEPPGQR